MYVDYTKIGKRIRATRKQRGLSQERLAEMAEVGTGHISHIENGHTKVSVQTLVNICNALDVSADELLCGQIYQAKTVLADETAALLASCGA
jgi:transcriptional regulator with XRE-family HTH domain